MQLTQKNALIGSVVTVASGILITTITNPDVIKVFTDASIKVLTRNNEQKKSPKETLEKFDVAADSETGYIYTHPEDEQPAKLKYNAPGKWTAIPKRVLEEGVPRGETDANGYSDADFSSNPNKPCPDLNTAALVIKGEDGQCLSSGKTGSFTAEPEHEYRFIMNDNFGLYKDNTGTINVTLSKKN